MPVEWRIGFKGLSHDLNWGTGAILISIANMPVPFLQQTTVIRRVSRYLLSIEYLVWIEFLVSIGISGINTKG